jgi:hypothetical protein
VFVVYLAWRFVRAHERLADAAERLATGRDEVVGADTGTDAGSRADDESAQE